MKPDPHQLGGSVNPEQSVPRDPKQEYKDKVAT
jgi:hypothetical protein